MKTYYKSNYLVFVLCVLLLSTSSYAQNDENWYILQMDSLPLIKTKVYVDTPTIRVDTYNQDNASVLKASIYDRMLFVLNGKCIATIKSEALDIKTNDVVFLKANDSIEFSENIKIMLWTSKSTKTNHEDKTEIFTAAQIDASRDASENVYNSFIEVSTMVAGLYMLPKSLNGDDTLNHEFDEINYVVNGTAKFKMNDTVIHVKPGSIMWVKRGVGHSFYDLSDDFDVFILFETIHMNHDH